jgi:membrane protein DedA with SNARE-associated domain
VQALLDWFAQLPPLALYAALALFSAVENIFPPVPADTVVAFGSFLAARGTASLALCFAATLGGNLAGAGLALYAGRRLGAEGLHRFLAKRGHGEAEVRVRALYARWGLAALFLSRFLPGVRAVLPPMAGALRVPVAPALLAMGVASAIWYGVISFLAYRLGRDWRRVLDLVGTGSRTLGLVVLGLVALGAMVWWLRQRRRRA